MTAPGPAVLGATRAAPNSAHNQVYVFDFPQILAAWPLPQAEVEKLICIVAGFLPQPAAALLRKCFL